MSDESLFIEAKYDVEILLEAGFEIEVEICEFDSELEPYFCSASESMIENLYPEIQVIIGITIENGKVMDQEIVNWDFI